MRQTVKVILKHDVIEGVLARLDGQNAYIEDVNGTEYKFHVDELVITDNGNRKQLVKIGNKLVNRVIRKVKRGDRYVTYNNEEFLLRWHDNGVQTVVSSNLTTHLWNLQDYVNNNMHHMDKLGWNSKSYTLTVFESIKREFKRNETFLYEWYEVDAHCLQEWIEYAETELAKHTSKVS